MTEEIKKRKGRGITNDMVSTSQLKFNEKHASNNALFIGHLEEVTVKWTTGGENGPFNGYKIPYLSFHFESNENDVNIRKHVYKHFFPQSSNIDTVPNHKYAWMVDNILKWPKHAFDVYTNNRNLTDAEQDALRLGFDDYNEETDEWISLDTQEIIDGYAFFFNNVAAIFNGSFGLKEGETPKPIYKTADGKFIPVWMKLLRAKKTGNVWRNVTKSGDLGFDEFLGQGAIEKVNGNNPPIKLVFDVAKESITPKENPKPTIGGFQQIPGAVTAIPNMLGTPMVGSEAAAFNAANGDTPF